MPEPQTQITTGEAPAQYTSFPFDSFGLTDTGRVREHNEDAFLCLPQHGVFCVADGMGGMRDGDVASRTTATCVQQAFAQISAGKESNAEPPFSEKLSTLITALEEANQRMQPSPQETGRRRSGSTVVALLIDLLSPTHASVVHAGDSRLYRFREGHLKQITQDHSATAMLDKLDKKAVNSKMAKAMRGVVTSGIGLGKKLDYEKTDLSLRSSDLFLLCSDGLSNMLKSDDIRDILSSGISESSTASVLCSRLIEAANTAGGHDNITAIIVRMGEVPEAVTREITATQEVDDPEDTAVIEPPSLSRLYYQALRKWMIPHKRAVSITATVTLVLVLWLITAMLRKNDNGDSLALPPIPAAPSRAEAITDAQREEFLSRLEDDVESAMRSGYWATLQTQIDTPNAQVILSTTDQGIPQQRLIESWYALWIQAASPEFDPERELTAFIHTHKKTLREITDSEDVLFSYKREDWPPDATEAANFFCADVYDIQHRFLAAVLDARNRVFTTNQDLVIKAKELIEKNTGPMGPVSLDGIEQWMHKAEQLKTDLYHQIIRLSGIRNSPWAGARRSVYDGDKLVAGFKNLRLHHAEYSEIEVELTVHRNAIEAKE